MRIKQADTTGLIGRRFGNFLVLSFNGSDSRNVTQWNCICLCGNVATVSRNKLMLINRTGGRGVACKKCRYVSDRRYEGDTQDVIEHRQLTSTPANAIRHVGEKLGPWLVVEYLETLDDGEYLYLCICDCGSEIEATIEEVQALAGVSRDGSGSSIGVLPPVSGTEEITDGASAQMAGTSQCDSENRAA